MLKKITDIDISKAITAIREFKQSYDRNQRVISIGNIEDLLDNFDTIEGCLNKHKTIPIIAEREFRLFKWKWNYFCGLCGALVEPDRENYCHKCGQRICK